MLWYSLNYRSVTSLSEILEVPAVSLRDCGSATFTASGQNSTLAQQYTAVYLPTNEVVSIISSSSSDSSNGDAKLSSSQDSSAALFLTDLDRVNMRRGYSTYLPTTKQQFEQYWRLCYGIVVSFDNSSRPTNVSHHTTTAENEVGATSSSKSIPPTKLVLVRFDDGLERVVPIESLTRCAVCRT